MGAGQQISGSGLHPSMLVDGFAWFLNVSSAVTIVFVNKVLMDPRKGYAFTYACTLSAIHFLTAAACIAAAQMAGLAERATLPWRATLYFSVIAVISIASLNLSLLVNPVGLYQVAKLLVIPFVCGVEAIGYGRRFNMATIISIATVVIGVAVVTVNDLGSGSTSLLGVIVAGVSVVGSGMQQILCGAMQREYKLQSHQLLAATAPVQGSILLVSGPFIDAAVSGNWIGGYALTTPAVAVLLASCVISVGVNVSQFMCLGRFTAVTFQVIGHTKTILVLLISWLALGEQMSARKLLGMAVAVAGMIAYGYFVNGPTPPAAKARTSKTGANGDATANIADALESGKNLNPGVTSEDTAYGADDDQTPLLRNVSKDNSWASQHVVVMQVDHSK